MRKNSKPRELSPELKEALSKNKKREAADYLKKMLKTKTEWMNSTGPAEARDMIRRKGPIPAIPTLLSVLFIDDAIKYIDEKIKGAWTLLGLTIDIARQDERYIKKDIYLETILWATDELSDALKKNDLKSAIARAQIIHWGMSLLTDKQIPRIETDKAIAKLSRAPAPTEKLGVEAATLAVRIAVDYSRWRFPHIVQAIKYHPRLRDWVNKNETLAYAFMYWT